MSITEKHLKDIVESVITTVTVHARAERTRRDDITIGWIEDLARNVAAALHDKLEEIQADALRECDDIGEATSIMRRWHYSEIRSLVDCAISDMKAAIESAGLDDDDAREEWLNDYIDTATDDHNHVIYTFKAKVTCLASDNDDAYEENYGEKPPTVEAQACAAMRADCRDLLRARDEEWKVNEEEAAGLEDGDEVIAKESGEHDRDASVESEELPEGTPEQEV